ncbi:synaptotagmin-4 [Alosa sapidissima]|uniref:synaptotagmin-4 n=1 Tax=Alosa sapidissima TaxID=34773 RepID=UPI001C098AD5|nr:synaptotagmin-4 [Alosa sapidissima]
MPLQMDVHVQILLAVGLAILCFFLVLGCFLCWRRRKSRLLNDKEAALSLPPLTSDPTATATVAPSAWPSIGLLPVRQQYEELEGDVLDFPALSPSPSATSASPPSEDGLSVQGLAPRPRSSSDLHESSSTSASALARASCFPLRRLSSPAAPCSPLRSPSPSPSSSISHGRASLPSIPKLGLVSRTKRALERRCSVAADGSVPSGEGSRLTCPQPASTALSTSPQLTYGSASSSSTDSSSTSSFALGPSVVTSKPGPLLHFTLLFSPSSGMLSLTVLGISGAPRRLGGVFVRASLPPLHPTAVQASTRRRSLSPEFQSQSFQLDVGDIDALRGATLRLAAFCRDFSGLREAPLAELELPCAELDWEPDTTITCTRQMELVKRRLRKSVSSQETLGGRRMSVCAPRALGQLFVLLQYQTVAHRIKVMVRKAENLAKLTRMPGAPDHYVVINLRQSGKVIATKETKGAAGHNAVWNAPFLFDLPSGDIIKLPLVLEFIVMQGRLYTKSSVLGCVLIGYEGPESGQVHWKEMCARGQVETARWHTLQPETLAE